MSQSEDQSHTVEEDRRYPSTLGGLIYLGLLAVALTGISIGAVGSWRIGIYCLSAALIAGCVARLFLSERDAGMLAVRSRKLDCLLLLAMGLVMIALTMGLPADS